MVPVEQINILLVDDTPANLMALEVVLRHPRYNIVQASSGEEAVALLHLHKVALILLDVLMPKMDGYQTAHLIKSFPEFKDIPIVFVSAIYKEDDFVRKGYEAGGVDYFGKPFNTDALILKVGIYAELYAKNEALRQKETSAERREAELNAVLESIPDPIYVGDHNGITKYNQAALDFFGIEQPNEIHQRIDLLAQKLKMRYPSGAQIPFEDQAMSRALRGEQYSATIVVENPKTRIVRTITVAAAPIYFQRKIIGAVVINNLKSPDIL